MMQLTVHPSAELLDAGLRAVGQLRVTVVGRSMSPLLRPGDHVVLEPVAVHQLRRGDIITVWRGNALLTHRVINVEPHRWQTKGDHCRTADPPMSAMSIVGRVAAIERAKYHIDLRCRRWQIIGFVVGWLGWYEAQCFQPNYTYVRRILGHCLHVAQQWLITFALHTAKKEIAV